MYSAERAGIGGRRRLTRLTFVEREIIRGISSDVFVSGRCVA
jgi:hypothetical protein